MPYITIKEYADFKGITVQSVYSNIKKGLLKSIKQFKDGKTLKYVEISEEEFKAFESDFKTDFKEIETDFKPNESNFTEFLIKENERKDKIINELNQQIKDLQTQLSEYTLRFAEIADKAITTTAHAQMLVSAEKQTSIPIQEENEQVRKNGFFKRLFKKN